LKGIPFPIVKIKSVKFFAKLVEALQVHNTSPLRRLVGANVISNAVRRLRGTLIKVYSILSLYAYPKLVN
jgi:hypothetical protein